MELTAEQFLFFKDYILNKRLCYKSLKDMLLDETNYTIDGDKLIINSNEFWEEFLEELKNYVFNDNIVEETQSFSDECDYTINFVCKVKERYFFYRYHNEDGFISDSFEEVFPVEVKIKSYTFSDGFLTNDTLDIIDE